VSCRHSLVSCPNFKEIKLGNKKRISATDLLPDSCAAFAPPRRGQG
jgi:hypothetical protein